jgi:hypothetical protein
LSVEGIVLTISDLETCETIAVQAVGEADGHRAQRESCIDILCSSPFRPGELFHLLEQQNVELLISRQEFIDIVVAAAESYPMAAFKSGYWADHWCYYIDLISSYLSIYPDWEERLLFESELPYFFSPAFVKPRAEKYVLCREGDNNYIRQLNATANESTEKSYRSNFAKDTVSANWQHDVKGNIFKSTAISKLFLLATLKFATRDAYGMGIEYEGGRPGLNDANNGIVAMLGSGMPETYELVILLRYIKSAVAKFNRPVIVPTELLDMIKDISDALALLESTSETTTRPLTLLVPASRFTYWDTVATARERYRETTKVTFNGKTEMIDMEVLCDTVETWIKEVESGIKRALEFGERTSSTGVSPTYFYYTVTGWKVTAEKTKDGQALVVAKMLELGTLPLFLEGPTKMMKTVGPKEANMMYHAVKSSPLRDEQLGMYTISESLKGQSLDLGRDTPFTPGWLENQSVWMHQSYKFYLELLRHELFDEFFQEMVSGGMLPFMEPDIYGRSPMECSSFIASSAYEDPSVRGRGFLARLSGSTSEFLSMWVLLMIGPKPFSVDKTSGWLQLRLIPALPRWMFRDASDTPPNVSFKLFGAIDVTYYHDLGMIDLYRVPPSRYVIGLRDGSVFNVKGQAIPYELADKIRRVVFVDSIDVYFE